MVIHFHIQRWSAWAPGLADADAWRRWAVAPWLPVGEQRPDLSDCPPLHRRRAERLGRMALHCAQSLCESGESLPMLFASRHGEAQRSAALLAQLASEGTVSPGGFSLSVHNAVAALHSIAWNGHGNYSAVAAGVETVEMALIEAVGLLADGSPSVILTVYDETIPAIYAEFGDEPDAAYAWSWRLTAASEASPAYRLDWSAAPAPAAAPATPALLPHGLDVLRFVLAGEPMLTWRSAARQWHWRRRTTGDEA